MIIFNNISIQRGTKLLLDSTSLAIYSGQKVGLVGRNGCGKSTIFAMLRGELETDQGDITIQQKSKIAHLAQEMPHGSLSAIEYVMQGEPELYALYTALKTATQQQNHTLAAELHAKLYERNGYALKARAGEILNGLCFRPDEHEQPIDYFSGGWRMRLNLAKTLIQQSDILLLDEPTNHLDLDAIIWFEKWLQNYAGTLILISHDREILDNVVTRIVHIDNLKLNVYSGNYTYFEEQYALNTEQQQARFIQQQKKLQQTMQFINRFRYKKTKAKQVQSRIKALEKLELVSDVHQRSPFYFSFQPLQKKITAPLLQLQEAAIGYDDKNILSQVSINICAGDRIGLLGANGAGKSTLIKCFAAALTPQQGIIFRHKALTIGYFAQHLIEQLDLSQTPLEHLQQLPRLQQSGAAITATAIPQLQPSQAATEQKLRSFLGSFGFTKEMIKIPLENLSGGEKARFVLATIVWQTPNLLLLDEPTNHLDLEMRSALTFALQEYQGAVVLVSHDRHLLKTTAENLYLINNGQVKIFDGDVDNYAEWVIAEQKNQHTQLRQAKLAQQLVQTNNAATAAVYNDINHNISSNINNNCNNPLSDNTAQLAPQTHDGEGYTHAKLAIESKPKRPIKNQSAKIKKLEDQLRRLCEAREKLDLLLANNELYQSNRAPLEHQKLNQLLAQREKLNQEITELELAWLELNVL
jgi:ATP-binding cassette, subfamily F, member 3